MSNSEPEWKSRSRPPVTGDASSSDTVPLVIRRQNPDLEVELFDAFDRLLAAPSAGRRGSSPELFDTSFGTEIHFRLPRGLYLVRGSLGDQRAEKVVILNAATNLDAPIPARYTSAAYQGVDSSHEYYSYTAAEMSRSVTTTQLADDTSKVASLFLFFRAWDRESYQQGKTTLEEAANRWFLQSPRGTWFEVAKIARFHPDGWLACTIPAESGTYLLHDLHEPYRTTLIQLYPGWQTQLFLTFDKQLRYDTLRIFLSAVSRGFEPDDNWARAVDLALSVLIRGQGAIPLDARQILLEGKFENPMLGLIVAWLLLREADVPQQLVDLVLDNLDRLLPQSPDVQALRAVFASRFPALVSTATPIRDVPMLYQAAVELIRLSTSHVKLLSSDNALHRINGRLYADCPFTTWQTTDLDLASMPLEFVQDLIRRVGKIEPLSMLEQIVKTVSQAWRQPFGIRSIMRGGTDWTGTVPWESSREWDDAVEAGTGSEDEQSDGAEESAFPSTTIEYDESRMLIDAVADVIERQSRWNASRDQKSALVLPDLALRAGLTLPAVQQALHVSPLKEMTIGFSISDRSASDQLHEDFPNQINEATSYLARNLISLGASLAYGGDFRPQGFTRLLAELIRSYNETATRPAQSLDCYQAAHLSLSQVPSDLPIRIRHLLHTPELALSTILPTPADSIAIPVSLYFSDMRRVMTERIAARVILGGQSEPRLQADGTGYSGRFPGIAEEAWRTLNLGKPLYVVGGFGGAAALVADLLENLPTPTALQDATFSNSQSYQSLALSIDQNPFREKLGLPKSLDDLADAIRQLSRLRLATNQTAIGWNGLTIDENRELWRTRDLERLNALILKGLMIRQQADQQGASGV